MGVKISELPAATTPLTGDEVFAVVQDGVTKQVSISNGVPYKKYVALLTQSGTNAPVPTILENTLGGVPLWAYVATGVYSAS